MSGLMINRSSNVAVVTCSGLLTVDNSDKVRQALMDAFSGSERVIIDFDGLSDVDSSFCQLVCSAHNAAARMNKKLSMSERCPEQVRQLFDDLGITMAGSERTV